MLHPLPDTRQRKYLHFACWMQRRLIRALCGLNAGTTVDLNWLYTVWPDVDIAWVKSFWGNKDGPRNTAMNVVSQASRSVKRALWRSTLQQTRIRRLYKPGSTIRIVVLTWSAPKQHATTDQLVFEAFAQLMRAFYERELKKGFTLQAGKISYESILDSGLAGSRVCPFCDAKLDPRNRVIDHFFSQEHFPVLICFPDNLIPICDTCNGPRAKLAKPPYTPNANNEVDASEWFHPRWRTGEGKVVAKVGLSGNQLVLKIEAINPAYSQHVNNFVQLTKVDTSWSDRLSAAVRQEQNEVESELRRAKRLGAIVDRGAVEATLREKRDYFEDKIGKEEHAYRKRGIYEFMATDNACVREILAQVNE